jgi:hypothetical protein
MELIASRDRARSIPFRILDGESERGARFGGRAPEGAFEGRLRDDAVYVMTLPLAKGPAREISIFRQGELWDAMNAGLFSDERIVAIVHEPSRRRKDRRWASHMSEHRIVLGDELDDMNTADDGETKPRADHKIGGRPYCLQEPELEGAEALLERGLVQLVQLDFPSADDGDISGNWPFADGMFNLFGAPPFDTVFWAFQK